MTVPTFPIGVAAQGLASLWFLPAIAGLTSTTPKILVSEFSAATAVNLTGMVDAFGVAATQDSGTDIRYGSTQVFGVPGRTTLAPAGALDYVYDPQKPAAPEYGAYTVLKDGTIGFFVNRLGLDIHTAPAAGQYVDIYPIQVGRQNRKQLDPTASAAKYKVEQLWFIVGPAVDDVLVATA